MLTIFIPKSILTSRFVVVDSIMVSTLDIGPKVCNKNLQLAFGGEVKPEAPCRKILHVSKYEQRYFIRQNSSFPLPVPSALLLDDCWQDCMVYELGVFPCQYHYTMVLQAHISPRDE
jgi:hypothetical protein